MTHHRARGTSDTMLSRLLILATVTATSLTAAAHAEVLDNHCAKYSPNKIDYNDPDIVPVIANIFNESACCGKCRFVSHMPLSAVSTAHRFAYLTRSTSHMYLS
jgi:hypothetical protein